MTRKLVNVFIGSEFERFYSDRKSLERFFSYVVFVVVVSIGCYNTITVNKSFMGLHVCLDNSMAKFYIQIYL